MENPFVRRAAAGVIVGYALFVLVRTGPGALLARPRPVREERPQRRPRPERPPLPPVRTERLFGLCVGALDVAGTVERIVAWSHEVPARTVIAATLDHVFALRGDPLFRRACEEADLVTAGAMPFVWLSRRKGGALKRPVTGADLVEPLATAAAAAGRSVFLFGSTLERLHSAAKRLKEDNPRLTVAGAYAPPSGFERDPQIQRELITLLRTVRPDIILVALDPPAQEIWSAGMADCVRHGVFVNVGAGLDHLAGEPARAPDRRRSSRLEGPWRALGEPFRRAPRAARIVAMLPWLLAMDRRDRLEFDRMRRRQAMAASTDRRYRERRREAREREAVARRRTF